ncbi:MAG: PilZ domain-containing protein [Nitrospiria bacterium]
MGIESNQMNHPRKTSRMPVATAAIISQRGVETTSKVLVRDLSAEGMGFYGPCPYSKGTMLLIRIKLITTTYEVIEESIIGRVVWEEKQKEDLGKDKQYSFGVEFRKMEERNPRLFAYIKEFEKISHQA